MWCFSNEVVRLIIRFVVCLCLLRKGFNLIRLSE